MVDEQDELIIDYKLSDPLLGYYIYFNKNSISIEFYFTLFSFNNCISPEFLKLYIPIEEIYRIDLRFIENYFCSSIYKKYYSFKIGHENSETTVYLTENELQFFIKLFITIRDISDYKDQFKLDEKIFDNIF